MSVEGVAVAAAAAFALWTLCANAAYALQWSLLAAAALGCFAGAGVIAVALVRGMTSSPPGRGSPEGPGEGGRDVIAELSHGDNAAALTPTLSQREREREPNRQARLPVLLAALLTLLAWLTTGQFLALWAGAVIVGVAGIRANATRRIAKPLAPQSVWKEALVGSMAIIAAFLGLTVRSFSADDAYYLNRAAQLAEDVWSAMPHHYGLFGDEVAVPFPYPTFPLTAYHDLIGFLSAISWLQPLQVCSILCAPVAAALVPVAYAVLLRRLLPPRVWPWALAVAMALLLLEATGERFVSQFGLPRIWQGKSILLHVGLPLVLAWGIDLGARGRVRDALRLAAGLIALVGLNSMGIWIGPVTAAAGVAVGLAGQNGSLRDSAKRGAVTLALFLAACWYPALLASVYAGGSEMAVGYRHVPPDLSETLLTTFGSERVMAVWLALVLAAPAVAPSATARLLAAVTITVTFGLALNPWLAPLVSSYVTSGVLYWRVLWLLPVVPIAASALCAGFAIPRHWGTGELLPGVRSRQALTAGSVVLAVLLYGWLVPERWTVSRGNRVGLGLPAVKAPAGPWRVARRLRAELPPDAAVLAPTSVSWLLVTLTDAPRAILPRPTAVEHAFGRQLGDAEEAQRRLSLANYLGGQKDLDAVNVWDAVESYRVSALVLRPPSGPPEPPEPPERGEPLEARGLAGTPQPTEPAQPPTGDRASDRAERERLRDLLSAGEFVRTDVAGFEVWLRQGRGADER